MAGTDSLNSAKARQNDEFYTQLNDIENELRHYKKHFKGKTVFCNCDDPFESNFFKYFALNFNRLGLKKLIATCYVDSPIAGEQLSLFDVIGEYENDWAKTYKAIVTTVHDANGDGGVDMFDVAELFKSGENELVELDGDGDFRSAECIELLKESDIVCTNPPFSLFREYIAQLMKYEKKFIIIGNQNATHYKEVFPLLRDNQIWLGYNHVKNFIRPDGSIQTFGNVLWFTNLDIKKLHEEIILVKKYDPELYPRYENLDAIDVSRVSDIPYNYAGWMGVPDNFLEIYNPDQFEIIGTSTGDLAKQIGVTKNYRGRTDVAYIDKNGKHKCPYQRLIIRNKHPEGVKE